VSSVWLVVKKGVFVSLMKKSSMRSLVVDIFCVIVMISSVSVVVCSML